MLQTRRKTNVAVLATVSLLAILILIASALYAMPVTKTVDAAGTRTMETITIADMYANRTTGKYGNFSWDPSKLQEITSSSFTIKASVAAGYQPFYICWTRPTGTAYPSKLNYGYTIGTGVNGDSASKTWTSSFPSDVSFSGIKTYPVGEVSLSGNYDTIYFCMGHKYMYDDLVVTSITFQPKINTVKVTATAGTGVSSVYLSKDQNATSGSASGTSFDKGDTVYAFATLMDGYKRPNTGWQLVSGTADSEGAIYRVTSYTMGTSDYNFGTINANFKQKNVSRNLNGGGTMSGVWLNFGQTADLTVPTRTGYIFNGWNTERSGSGTTYGNANGATLTVEQVKALISDDSITTFYAQWTAQTYTVSVNGTNKNLTYGENFTLDSPAPEEGYTFVGYFDGENGTGKQYTNAEGNSVCTWDKAENNTSLYPYFTKNMTVSAQGYEGYFDGEAHTITVTVNEPTADYTVTYGEVEDSCNLASVDKTDVGTYTIYFKVSKAGYTDYSGYAVVKINEVDKTELQAKINETSEYYLTIVDNYASIAATLDGQKQQILINYYNEQNVTAEQVAEAVSTLDGYIKAAKVAVTEAKINAIPNPVTYEQACMDAIDAAREAFDALESAEQEKVENISTLTAAEKAYADLEQAAAVVEAISELGEVDISKATEIFAAAQAYASLTADQKALVTNREELFAVEIQLVEAFIADIPSPVVYTTECKNKIDKAKRLYDNLGEEVQSEVENRQVLLDAETAYATLDDKDKANSVKTLIDAIGTVEYTEDCKAKIDAAREAYDSLTDEQKAFVENYETLTNAEATYAELQANAEKQLSGGAIVAIVIGSVVLAACLGVILWFFVFDKKKEEKEQDNKE